MSLPTDPNMAWPPAGAQPLDIATWRAWYSGNPAQLQANAAPPANRVARAFFWRRSRESLGAARPKPIHVPLAAEIAQSSADLLFGDPPDLRITDNEKASERLDEIAQASGLGNTLLEAAELCAALSGVYLRVSWDTEIAGHPFLTAVNADHAAPEFAYGWLSAVTFWRELPAKDKGVWRHLERHEPGAILHGLYVGDATHLGKAKELTDHQATAGLEPVVRLPDGVPAKLLVWYVPNVKPDRSEPTSPQGRADIQGAEDLLDGLDETYSSWVRDIRIGKARILVPHEALENPGKRGGGKWFDADREVFTELDGLDPKDMSLTVTEFAIRAADHAATAVDLLERITSAAGYSPQTFGLRIEGRAESGTALRIRESKTAKTVARKQRYWAPAVEAACESLLAVDRALFGSGVEVSRPQLVWPEEQQTPQELATTLELLRRAEAISTETAVRLAQPDLDEKQLTAEVERIRQESGSLVPEPAF
jgi:hypothetical protein